MSRRIESFALFAIAVSLRILHADACIFTTDQAGTLLGGHAVLAGNWFVPGPGIGWSAFALGPLFNQVAALAFFVRDDFADLVVLLGLLHGASVLGFRAMLGRVSDARVARVAAWALALHPVSITTGGVPISSSLVLPTTLLFASGIAWWIASKEPRGFALACVGAALMVQAHVTTLLLLPLFFAGFRARAPIGRVGLGGLLLAALIATPMLLHNLAVLGGDDGTIRHAGTEGGAPFVVALGRALGLEARVMELAGVPPGAVGHLVFAAACVWSAIAALGVLRMVHEKPTGLPRSLLIACALLPTLAIAAIPRGALFYYLDSTVPYRAWLFASGALALGSWADARGSRALRGLVRVVCVLACAIPAATIAWGRVQSAEHGYASIAMSRSDLREPTGRASSTIGILTLRSQRDLARALAAVGARKDALSRAVHGPWRWMMEGSTSVLLPEGGGGEDDRAFLVVHASEPVEAPPGAAIRAGAFRIYAFENRFRASDANDADVTAVIEGSGPARLEFVSDVGHEVRRVVASGVDRPQRTRRSPAGFAVTSIPLDGPGPLTLELGDTALSDPLVRDARDAYAFSPGR